MCSSYVEWLSRFNSQELEDGHVRIQFEDQAEQRVLWKIECMLERQLAAPFAADYLDQLAAARAAVRDPAECITPADARFDANGMQ